MGRQDEFLLKGAVSPDAGVTGQALEAVTYITDLLSELQTIANVSGLTQLSNDLNAVMMKHANLDACA